jgi:cytochrome c
MGSRKFAAIMLLLASPALAQTYGVGRTPTPDEIRAMDISISPTGEELPEGHGSAKEGATLFQAKGCVGCHGRAGVGAMAPQLQASKSPDLPLWERGRGSSGWMILPLTAPYATIVWDYIHRGMPLGKEGTLTADETYALTAYLLFLNHVIPEDQVLDKESLPKVKMPIGNDFARLPEWKHGTKRLQGYPY